MSLNAPLFRLHSPFYSTFGQRALFVLEESKIKDATEIRHVDFFGSEPHSAEYKKLNPLSKIPTLQLLDGSGRTVVESRAVARFLADQYAPELYPTSNDGFLRAKIEEWISFETSYTTPLLLTIADETIFVSVSPNRKTDQAKLDRAVEDLKVHLDYMEKQLEGKEYVANNTFSLADIVLTPDLQLVALTPYKSLIDASVRPNVAAWFARVTGRPSWQKIAARATEQMGADLAKATAQGKPTLEIVLENGAPRNNTLKKAATNDSSE